MDTSQRQIGSTGAPSVRPRTRPRVIAVAGGKGGVGKSVVTSSLAVAAAGLGHRCVVVDADLGGANLHTLLGDRRPERTLSDFWNGGVRQLSELMLQTPVRNLWLVSGQSAHVEAANPKHAQKAKLLRHLRTLPADLVFVDVSAGSAFNALDPFLAADRGILVVIPEPTSVENAYQFLRAAFYRWLRGAVKVLRVREAVEQVLSRQARSGLRSPRDLIAAVRGVDPEAGAVLERRAAEFAPLLIVNQAREAEHRQLGEEMRAACRAYFGTPVELLGTLDRDERVPTAVGRRQPVLHQFPECPFSRGVEALIWRLLGGRFREPVAAARAAVTPTWRPRHAGPPLATHGLLERGPAERAA